MLYSEQKHKRENRKDIGHFSKVGEGQSGQQLIKLHAVFFRICYVTALPRSHITTVIVFTECHCTSR